MGDAIPQDAWLRITCPLCGESFAAFGLELQGEVRCGCGNLLGEVRNGIRIK
jgi:ribosomal protein S27E